ncbi:MAG: hypothetical protein AB7P02_17080 [Alphaproteobacteria bacterium]
MIARTLIFILVAGMAAGAQAQQSRDPNMQRRQGGMEAQPGGGSTTSPKPRYDTSSRCPPGKTWVPVGEPGPNRSGYCR